MTDGCSPEGRARAIQIHSNLDGNQCLIGTAITIHEVTVSTLYLFAIRVHLYWECVSGHVVMAYDYPNPVILDFAGGRTQDPATHQWRLTRRPGAPPGPTQVKVRVGWYKPLSDGRAGHESMLSNPLIYNVLVQ